MEIHLVGGPADGEAVEWTGGSELLWTYLLEKTYDEADDCHIKLKDALYVVSRRNNSIFVYQPE